LRRDGTQFYESRQEPGQRLAGAGRRNQQRGTVVAGFLQQRQLVLARRPSARRKPAAETVRQQFGRFGRRSGADAGRHGKDVSRRGGFVEGGSNELIVAVDRND
jgi:hypothetical protein